jgi:hypothetical protein
MARDGLIRFETPGGEPLTPEEVTVPLGDIIMVLTDKGREFLARAQLGEEP